MTTIEELKDMITTHALSNLLKDSAGGKNLYSLHSVLSGANTSIPDTKNYLIQLPFPCRWCHEPMTFVC